MPEAPLFYDISTDKYRPVTKQDLDKLLEIAQKYGQISEIVKGKLKFELRHD